MLCAGSGSESAAHCITTLTLLFLTFVYRDWDMSRYLVKQCRYSEVPMPPWSYQWMNICLSLSRVYSCKDTRMTLPQMIEKMGLEFEGQLHRGIDNTRNIAKIVIQMLEVYKAVLLAWMVIVCVEFMFWFV